MPADLPPDLLARAERLGLTRDHWGRWRRLGRPRVALVWRTLAGTLCGVWCWAPESVDAPCSARTEAEALAAACDWIEAGEPEVARG